MKAPRGFLIHLSGCLRASTRGGCYLSLLAGDWKRLQTTCFGWVELYKLRSHRFISWTRLNCNPFRRFLDTFSLERSKAIQDIPVATCSHFVYRWGLFVSLFCLYPGEIASHCVLGNACVLVFMSTTHDPLWIDIPVPEISDQPYLIWSPLLQHLRFQTQPCRGAAWSLVRIGVGTARAQGIALTLEQSFCLCICICIRFGVPVF